MLGLWAEPGHDSVSRKCGLQPLRLRRTSLSLWLSSAHPQRLQAPSGGGEEKRGLGTGGKAGFHTCTATYVRTETPVVLLEGAQLSGLEGIVTALTLVIEATVISRQEECSSILVSLQMNPQIHDDLLQQSYRVVSNV